MKILVLTDGIFPYVIGGMQKHSYNLVKQLVLKGESVTLVHCVPFGKPLPSHYEVAEKLGLEKHFNFESIAVHFPQKGIIPGHYLKESYLYSKIVYDMLRDRLSEFDFIYAKGFSAWHFLVEKRNGQSIPPIGIKFHGYEMFQKPPSFKVRLERFLLRGPVKWNTLHADYVFSYGSKITMLIRSLGVSNKKIIEIPTGIESTWIKNDISGGDELRLVFLGRYERRKGIEELNRAIKNILSKEGYSFQIHFVGPIPPTKRINSKKVTYHGTVMDSEKIKEILDKCRVLVAPSHSEGMPNVIMEGMARGLAIVSTPVGAIEAVVDESNGWLISPGNSTQLQETLEKIILSDVSRIRNKQENSLTKISNFLWDKIGTQTIEKIKDVLLK